MASSRSKELYQALQAKGYPDDFCRELAYRQLNTDYTATRMLGYLYRISELRIEDVVDEMLAIQSDRNAIIQKKELEHQEKLIKTQKEELKKLKKQCAAQKWTIEDQKRLMGLTGFLRQIWRKLKKIAVK